MNNPSKTSITRTILVGLLAILVFFIVQTALVWSTARDIERDVVQTTSRNTLASSELSDLSVLAQQIRRYEKEYFIYVSNPERRNAYQKEWTDTYKKISSRLDSMAANKQEAFKNADSSQITSWRLAADFYASEMAKIFDTVNYRSGDMTNQQQQKSQAAAAAALSPAALVPVVASSKPPVAVTAAAAASTDVQGAASAPAPDLTMYTPTQANDMIKAGKDRFSSELIKGVGTMSAEKNKATLSIASEASEGFQKLIFGVLGTVVVGFLITMFLLYKLPRAVKQPIEALTQSVEAMSKGGAAMPVQAMGVTEFEGLGRALERMRLSQETMLQRLRSRPAAASIIMPATEQQGG